MNHKISNILLINPPSYSIKEPYDRTAWPNLALAYLGAILLQEGYNVICIDCKYEGLNAENLESRIKSLDRIDMIGVTAMTPNIIDAHNSINVVKKYFPEAIAIIGGCHATAIPKNTLRDFPGFDLAVIGEGEKTLVKIIHYLNSGKSLGEIEGLAYRDSNSLLSNASSGFIRDLDKIPFPAWHLFSSPDKTLPVITGRGCPFRCTFCQRVLGTQVRLRSPENVIEEIIQNIEKYNIKNINFPDETFTVNKKWLIKFLNLMIDSKLPEKITWSISTRVDKVDEETLKLMKDAGCTLIGYGIESGNNDILKITGKNITTQQAEKAVKITKSLGIKVNGYFLFGHPDETEETIKDTIRFAAKLNTDMPFFGIMVPYPGTEVRKMVMRKEHGFKGVSENWSDYYKHVGYSLEMENLPKKKLIRYQVIAYLYVYLSNFRFISLFRQFVSNFKTVFAIFKAWFKSNSATHLT